MALHPNRFSLEKHRGASMALACDPLTVREDAGGSPLACAARQRSA